MEINEKDIGLIEEYLDDNLHGEELDAFQSRLRTDSDFAALLKARIEMADLMKDADEYQQLKNQVGRVIESEKKGVFHSYRSYILPIAASIVILFGIYIIFEFRSNREEDSIEYAETVDEPSTLYIDKPEVLAKIKFVDSTVLKSPVDKIAINAGDAIQFTWQSNSDQFGILYVLNETDAVVFEKEVNLSKLLYDLTENSLPPGEYTWYINEPTNKGSFIIIK